MAHKKGSGQDNDTESSNKHQGVDDDEVPTLIDDSEERKIKSGGRSKKKVRINA